MLPFKLYCIVGLCLSLCAASPHEVPEKVHDVLIIGGGMAGMAAVQGLVRAGVDDFVILEARNYTGGRVHSVPFGLESIHRGYVEVGANWIHGASQKNPVWQFATESQVQSRVIPGSCANVSGYGLFDEDGLRDPNAIERSNRIMTAFDCINKTSKFAGISGIEISASAALAFCGWKKQDSLDLSVEWEVTSANDILPPQEQALWWMVPDGTYSRIGIDDHFVHDQRPRGYATVVDEMLEKVQFSSKDVRLHLDTPVAHISIVDLEDGTETVKAISASGQIFYGRFAISALPLGTMQRKHTSLFTSPSLPSKQAAALAAFTMGNFTKMFIQFPQNFWADRGVQWLVAADEADFPGGPFEFHDLGSLVPGFNTLFTYVVDKASVLWESMSDAEAADALVRRLQRQFPEMRLPPHTDFFMTRHGSDPFMFGAYSTMRVGVTREQFQEMVKPLRRESSQTPRVFFSGEHTCEAFTGFLHGAYGAGIQSAVQALQALGKKPIVECNCDVMTSRSDVAGAGFCTDKSSRGTEGTSAATVRRNSMESIVV